MLLESLAYLITPCSRMARKMGYLRESISIMSRYRRCRKDWSNHTSKTRQTISKAIEKCSGNSRAIIFGAGLGHDLPVRELLAHFAEVLLVDVVHTLPIRWVALRNRKVKLVTHDISESLDNIYKGELRVRAPERFLDTKSANLIVSLNLLSQLPTLPTHYLEKVYRVNDIELERLAKKLIEAHLSYLRQFSGVVCLVTDLDREILDLKGDLISKFSALRDISVPLVGETWLWEIAPLGEEDNSYSVRNRVIGIPDLSAADSIM